MIKGCSDENGKLVCSTFSYLKMSQKQKVIFIICESAITRAWMIGKKKKKRGR